MIFFLKKGNNFEIYFNRLLGENSVMMIEEKDCYIGEYKGVDKIRSLFENIPKNSSLPGYFFDVFKKVSIPFIEVKYKDFDFKNFKKFLDFSQSKEKTKILSLFEEKKSVNLFTIINSQGLNKLKSHIIDSTKLWQSSLESFCKEYRKVEGELVLKFITKSYRAFR